MALLPSEITLVFIEDGHWRTHAYSTRYLNDFSKALASEVRILLAEVGKLRDERRQLQL